MIFLDTKDLEMKYLFMKKTLGLDEDEIVINNKIFENRLKVS